jgi:hypothetical protein
MPAADLLPLDSSHGGSTRVIQVPHAHSCALSTPLDGWRYLPFGRVVFWVHAAYFLRYVAKGAAVTNRNETQVLINTVPGQAQY